MMPRFSAIRNLLFSFGLLGSPVLGLADQQWTTSSPVMRAIFGNVVGNSFSEEHPSSCLQKWAGPIEYSVHGNIETEQETLLEEALQHISRVSGLEHSRVEKGKLQITITATTDTASEKFKSTCSASRNADSGCELIGASVDIPTNLTFDQFRYCMLHELLHAHGLQGHPRHIDSIMNPELTKTMLTDWDAAVLDFVYSDDLSPGSTPRSVLKKLRTINNDRLR